MQKYGAVSVNYCLLDPIAKKFVLKQIDQMQLSARAYSRILKLGRTIADLAGSPSIELEHVAEAISFRDLDKPVEAVSRS